MLRQHIILWIILRYDYLRYDYLGNLWYDIIALNGIFIKKVSFFETASGWPANMMCCCSDCPWTCGSLSLSFGLIGLDHHFWTCLGNLKCSVQIFILYKHFSWILYMLINTVFLFTPYLQGNFKSVVVLSPTRFSTWDLTWGQWSQTC